MRGLAVAAAALLASSALVSAQDNLGGTRVIALVQGIEVNIKNPPFNALGDGVQDTLPSYQAAVAAAQASPFGCGTISFPPGIYVASSAYVIPSCINVKGAGRAATFLKNTGSAQSPLSITLLVYGTLTGTGPLGLNNPATYPINTPVQGRNALTTTTASDAGNFSPGNIIWITGGMHATNFWYPGWSTTVISANAQTGVISLAENLPFGGPTITTVQRIVYQPTDIRVSDLTVLGGAGAGSAAIQVGLANRVTFDNIATDVQGTDPLHGAYISIAGTRGAIVKDSFFLNYTDCLGCFFSTWKNNIILNGSMTMDGGTQHTSYENNTIIDPANTGSPATAMSIVSDSQNNRAVGNKIVNVPSGFTGIVVGQSNDATEGGNIICENQILGSDSTITGFVVGTSTNNTLCNNVISNASIGLRLSAGATGTINSNNQMINVATPCVADPAAGTC